jgi:hypothetical protein
MLGWEQALNKFYTRTYQQGRWITWKTQSESPRREQGEDLE